MAYSRTRRKRKRPPSEAALLHHRDIASLAMEFFSVLDGDDLEPVRDAAEPVVERTNLEKLRVADLTALGTPEMFNRLGDNHAGSSSHQWQSV